MILTPTTIVLGAGASKPYGLPLGWELRRNICNATNPNNFLTHKLDELFRTPPKTTTDFAKAFLYSNVASIDSFLAKNKHFEEIGKLCIAVELCSKENPGAVMKDDVKDHWYRLLWNKLIEETSDEIDLLLNKVRFVTFNYDRSLEYFLYESMKSTFSLSPDRTLEILEQFDILHVYGELGKFHYEPDPLTREYDSDMFPELIKLAANNIKIIPEARNEVDDSFKLAHKWFEDSTIIGFLGFGFDPLNVKRLDIKRICEAQRIEAAKLGKRIPYKRIIISTLDATADEQTKIASSIWATDTDKVRIYKENNTMTIRSSILFNQ